LSVFANGAVVLADSNNHCIRLLSPSLQKIETIAGQPKPGLVDGVGEKALFHNPSDVLVLDDKRILVADELSRALRLITKVGFSLIASLLPSLSTLLL